ncbi:hypothetical protein [Acrocarpospora sp. B8E8]|uniref:hypothetical protein n=1 Tax=Acrocarpospora sp. B8E8 TaxID=3153572 RepID=UPI00325F708E
MNAPSATALIVGDMQAGIVGAYAFADAVLPVLESVIPAARDAGVLVDFLVDRVFPARGVEILTAETWTGSL